jgi:Protein of unknown function (DUF3810)
MTLLRAGIVLLALAVALLPIPSRLVEGWYSRGIYPAIQSVLTPASAALPLAPLDLAVTLLVTVCLVRFVRRVRIKGFVRAVAGTPVRLATLAAVLYLAFVLLWGMNYRRLPIEQKLEFDASRITTDALVRLGEHAVAQLNSTHADAHRATWDAAGLERAFAAAQQMLGHNQLAVTTGPKRSALELYFRKAAIDGMTDPFFLQIIINPDVEDFERPFVLAHEWAHLSGYAHEAEASFVAWLTCQQGDALARYSGWFAIYETVFASLPKEERSRLAATLDPGPRHDVQRAAARYARSSQVVRATAREAYDTYLRANRVGEGIASYTGVVRLILGAGLNNGGAPRLR